MKKNIKVYSLLPLVGKDKVFAVPTEPINVLFIEAENYGYNVYVEQTNSDLKYITELKRKDGLRVSEKHFKEFAEAAATDELVRRADSNDGVEFYKIDGMPKTVKEAREIFLKGAELFVETN